MKVEVTQDDILQGTRYSSYSCPIAQALGRQTGEQWTVTAVGAKSRKLHLRLTVKAARFVVDYDMGKPVKPFTFVAREEK